MPYDLALDKKLYFVENNEEKMSPTSEGGRYNIDSQSGVQSPTSLKRLT